eukprot:scaffold181165_cov31-Tisochrysis_lutea.AAC.1
MPRKWARFDAPHCRSPFPTNRAPSGAPSFARRWRRLAPWEGTPIALQLVHHLGWHAPAVCVAARAVLKRQVT